MQASIVAPALAEDWVYQLAAPARPRAGHPAECFAARRSGLYVSNDGGKTWPTAYGALTLSAPLTTLCVALAPDFDQEPLVWAGVSGGLLRSTDGGRSWANIEFPAPAPTIIALVVSPNFGQDGLLFAATLEDGVLYSSDRGIHWRTGNLGLIDMHLLCLGISPDFEADATLLAGTHSGLFLSRNAARSWREVELEVEYDAVLSLALAPDFGRNGTLLAGTETQGLLATSDGGRHWQRLGRPVLTGAVDQILLSPAYPRDPRLLVLHEGQPLLSTDGGASWSAWQTAALARQSATAMLAPGGLKPGALVFVGLEGGQTLQVPA